MQLLTFIVLVSPVILTAQEDSLNSDSLRRPPEYYIDTWDDEFEMSDYLRIDSFQDDIFFVALDEKDSSVIDSCVPVPLHFFYWVKTDSIRDSLASDSIYIWDYKKLVGYDRRVDFLRVDSIYFRKREYYHHGDLDHYTFSGFCQYRNKLKHGREVQYYSIHELNGVVITGENYRTKSAGYWKSGKRHGKWKYFSKNGELERIEKWRNGELKRTHKKH